MLGGQGLIVAGKLCARCSETVRKQTGQPVEHLKVGRVWGGVRYAVPACSGEAPQAGGARDRGKGKGG